MILNFFATLFGYWNGVDAQEPILRILQYTPLLEFKGARSHPTHPLVSSPDLCLMIL